MKEDIESSIAAGFSNHITKPVDWQELKTAMQKIAEEILQNEEQPAAK
jgi:YesN/AraC family two-component response regulator